MKKKFYNVDTNENFGPQLAARIPQTFKKERTN